MRRALASVSTVSQGLAPSNGVPLSISSCAPARFSGPSWSSIPFFQDFPRSKATDVGEAGGGAESDVARLIESDGGGDAVVSMFLEIFAEEETNRVALDSEDIRFHGPLGEAVSSSGIVAVVRTIPFSMVSSSYNR